MLYPNKFNGTTCIKSYSESRNIMPLYRLIINYSIKPVICKTLYDYVTFNCDSTYIIKAHLRK